MASLTPVNRKNKAVNIKKAVLASNTKSLMELLDTCLNPKLPISDKETIEILKYVMSGGVPFSEFQSIVHQYDTSVLCGLVWTANFVAYRCRTCAISPCMSLCADCFHASDHTNHDYNMFRSQAGGACDCGDPEVLKEEGFCSKHGTQKGQKKEIPSDLLAVAKVMMPKLFYRLLVHLREYSSGPSLKPMQHYRDVIDKAERYITFLQNLCDMGGAMKALMASVLIDCDVYSKLCTEEANSFIDQYNIMLQSVELLPVAEQFRDKGINTTIAHHTMADEFVFWAIRYEFPQEITTLLLTFLPDEMFKVRFTESFVDHYSYVTKTLTASGERQAISNRVVHISVQLLSPEGLASDMATHKGLIQVMLTSLSYMITSIASSSHINDPSENYHKVVDCSHFILSKHCYWPIVSDFINILNHKSIARMFMEDTQIVRYWLGLVSYFQGMNLNKREMTTHIEYEPDTYYAAFSAELEICSSPMWSLQLYCTDNDFGHRLSSTMLKETVEALQRWFTDINIKPYSHPKQLQVSFHLPLHRYLAVFLSHAVETQHFTLDQFLPGCEFLCMLMIHLLQLQTVFYEILCGIWVRNGIQIKGQAMTYVQCHFCKSMVDADIYLLQVCGSKLDPDYFVKTIFERFRCMEFLTLSRSPISSSPQLNADKQMPMLEGALTLLTFIIANRINLGMSEEEINYKEIVALLCVSDQMHSQLIDMIPEKCGQPNYTRNYADILAATAQYIEPKFEAGGGMQQGIYVPRDHTWADMYDPLHVMLRAMHRKDFQSSMDRFTKFATNNKLYEGNMSPWPPFRIPKDMLPEYHGLRRLLHCRTLHGMIFVILYKALHDTTVTDTVLYLVVHLLELGLHIQPASSSAKCCQVQSPPRDKQFSGWFPYDSLLPNLRHLIEHVEVIELQTKSPSDIHKVAGSRTAGLRNSNASGSSTATSTDGSATNQQEGGGGGLAEGGGGAVSPLTHAFAHYVTAMSVDDEDSNPPTVDIPAPTVIQSPNYQIVSGNPTSILSSPLGPTSGGVGSSSSTGGGVGSGGSSSARTRSQGVSTDTDASQQHVTKTVPIRESIITLLMKLHDKLTGRTNSYQICPARIQRLQHTDSRVGDGAFFVSKLLDKICLNSEENAAVIQQICDSHISVEMKDAESSHAGPGTSDGRNSSDERRKRAKLRQQKLMQQFANKQKEFMKCFMDTSDYDIDVDEEMATSEIQNYDCVICNQNSESTSERPMGLICLTQATSVLGHRHHDVDTLSIIDPEANSRHMRTKCSTEYMFKFKNLCSKFQMQSALLSMNTSWEGGIHAQSCGHYVHLDCYGSYVASLQQHLRHKPDFTCPLCRRTAKMIFPIVPPYHQPKSHNPPKASHSARAKLISDILRQPVVTEDSELTRAMNEVYKNLQITSPHYKLYAEKYPVENDLLFLASVARSNLELELLSQGGTLCTSEADARETTNKCIEPLIHVLRIHAGGRQTFAELWHHVTGLPANQDASWHVTTYKEEVPLLLKDTTTLMLHIVLCLSEEAQAELLLTVIQAMYNITYLQALAAIGCKFTNEERNAWVMAGKQPDKSRCYSLEGLLSQMIQHLSTSPLFEEEQPVDPVVPALCQSVWSPHSVESLLQDWCLPYLRIASLLYAFYTHKHIPPVDIKNGDTEFSMLCKFLQLGAAYCDHSTEYTATPTSPNKSRRTTTSTTASGSSSSGITGICGLCGTSGGSTSSISASSSTASAAAAVACSGSGKALAVSEAGYSASAVLWMCDRPETLIQGCCQHFCHTARRNAAPARHLLTLNPIWSRPHLFMLPNRYEEIFQHYRKRQCRKCHLVPQEPALCLVCSRLLCFKSECCKEDNFFECVLHARTCGGGTGVFLIIHSSVIIIIRDKRASIWGSVYLDSHGEEDKDLRRGRPLFLSKERYQALQQQWISHSFDYVCKRWILHKNQF